MTEDSDEISIGIVLSTILFATYIYISDRLMQIFKIYELIQTFEFNNIIMFIIYFIPLIILYVRIPIFLRRHKGWQKYF